jgi:hypothetical protein
MLGYGYSSDVTVVLIGICVYRAFEIGFPARNPTRSKGPIGICAGSNLMMRFKIVLSFGVII